MALAALAAIVVAIGSGLPVRPPDDVSFLSILLFLLLSLEADGPRRQMSAPAAALAPLPLSLKFLQIPNADQNPSESTCSRKPSSPAGCR